MSKFSYDGYKDLYSKLMEYIEDSPDNGIMKRMMLDLNCQVDRLRMEHKDANDRLEVALDCLDSCHGLEMYWDTYPVEE